ncbi:MAG: cell division protein ZapA [Pseudomonadales bacterium]
MSQTETVTINIIDKDFQVNCPPEEKDALLNSARHLDTRMRAMRDSGKIVGLDRIAVMAALNTTYELLQSQATEAKITEVSSDKLVRLSNKIDDALHFCRQLEI